MMKDNSPHAIKRGLFVTIIFLVSFTYSFKITDETSKTRFHYLFNRSSSTS